MRHPTLAVLPREVEQSGVISGCRRDLCANAEVFVMRLFMCRGREVVDVLHHLVPGHPGASVDAGELEDARKVVMVPVDIPDDFAGLPYLLDSLDRVLR